MTLLKKNITLWCLAPVFAFLLLSMEKIAGFPTMAKAGFSDLLIVVCFPAFLFPDGLLLVIIPVFLAYFCYGKIERKEVRKSYAYSASITLYWWACSHFVVLLMSRLH